MYSGQLVIKLPEVAAEAFGKAGHSRPRRPVGDAGFEFDSTVILISLRETTPSRLFWLNGGMRAER
jgi:hypothetical protein